MKLPSMRGAARAAGVGLLVILAVALLAAPPSAPGCSCASRWAAPPPPATPPWHARTASRATHPSPRSGASPSTTSRSPGRCGGTCGARATSPPSIGSASAASTVTLPPTCSISPVPRSPPAAWWASSARPTCCASRPGPSRGRAPTSRSWAWTASPATCRGAASSGRAGGPPGRTSRWPTRGSRIRGRLRCPFAASATPQPSPRGGPPATPRAAPPASTATCRRWRRPRSPPARSGGAGATASPPTRTGRCSDRRSAPRSPGRLLRQGKGLFGREEALLLDFWPFAEDSRIPAGAEREAAFELPEGHGTVEALVTYHDWQGMRRELLTLREAF